MNPQRRQQSERAAKRSPRRPIRWLFFALSVSVHLLISGALAVIAYGEAFTPKVDITWLDLKNTLGAPRKKAPTKRAAVKKAPPKKDVVNVKPKVKKTAISKRRLPKKRPVAKKKRPVRKPRPIKRPKGPFTTDKVALTTMVPGDAALMLLLRMDRIRQSPYRVSVRRLLEVFYDYKTLLWSTGIDAVRDFDAMLIATPNPYRVRQTFLAIRHGMPTRKLRRAIARATRHKGKRTRWKRDKLGVQGKLPTPPALPGDRRVLLLRGGLALLCAPEHQRLLDPPPEKTQKVDPAASSADLEPTLLDRLQQMEQEGGAGSKDDEPALLLQAINLPRLVRLPRDIPTPLNLQVTVPATVPARVSALLTFGHPKTAQRFLAAIGPRIAKAKRSLLLRLLGVGSLLDGLSFSQKNNRVTAIANLDADQVKAVLELLRSAIPQIEVPGMPPRLAPDSGAELLEKKDAGIGAPPTKVDTTSDAGPPNKAKTVEARDGGSKMLSPDAGAQIKKSSPDRK